jgi:S1-C subfamily serine protease
VNALDIIILVLVAAAAIHGLRLGAAIQVVSFTGFILGLALGALLVYLIAPHIHGSATKAIVAMLLLFIPAGFLGGVGRQLGVHAWRAIRDSRLGKADAAAGCVLAVAGTLVLSWLFASVLVNSQFNVVSSQIDSSKIIRALDQVMPPVPNKFLTVERYLSQQGFPLVFANIVPEEPGPVTVATPAQVKAASDADAASTVKIVGYGCGGIQQEGSGFVVAPHLVVTNAHVVAGISNLTVETLFDSDHRAFAVYFDPKLDLAVLEVEGPSLPMPPLHLDSQVVERGTRAVVLGYPEDGPFNAQPAGVEGRSEAVGLDIYGNAETTRTVYTLDAFIRPGNSGGPLIEPNGLVIGVVFSRLSGSNDEGFALASPAVLAGVQKAEAHPVRTSTEGCVSS